MSEDRQILKDNELEKIIGGFFSFNSRKQTLTYMHRDGSVTMHQIMNFNEAWERSNTLHAQNVDEDEILADLIRMGLIEG